jgi:hypothetical protein
MEMRNRPFEFNILVVYLKWTKIVEVDENCRFIIKFLKEVNDLWRKKFKLFNKGTNCLLSIENKYQNIVLRFIHLWRHIRKSVKWTKTADVALYMSYFTIFYPLQVHLNNFDVYVGIF